MTVTYTEYVQTSRTFPSAFVRLLRRWRGSIYKLIYFDLLIFLGIYYLIKILYLFALSEDQKTTFHAVVAYFNEYNSKIPVSFFLGFFVSTVAKRWSDQVYNVPWPDPGAVFVSSQIRGNDERGRKMRRTVMRYLCLGYVMLFRLISPRAKKRFPTLGHLVDAGFLMENEKSIIEAIDEIYPKQPKYWMPIVWASSIFTRARKEGRIRDDFALRTLNDAINSFRNYCILLLHFDTLSVPLIYTQVVALTVYAYFAASLIANQWVDVPSKQKSIIPLDYYFPLFTTLEFFFYMGWLKVAETLICPFGDDDDDFEVNAMIDRNLQVSYIIVDEMHNKHPQLIKDQFWNEIYPAQIPGADTGQPEHSTAHLDQKPITAKQSISNVKLDGDYSKTQFLWKRFATKVTEDMHTDTGHHSSDTDRTINEEVYNLHEGPSKTSMQGEYETYEDEGEEEAEVEGYTFERLREERERERNERKHQKVLRTVENVADATEELRMRKLQSEVSSSTDSSKDKQNKADKKKDDQQKEDDDQDQNQNPNK